MTRFLEAGRVGRAHGRDGSFHVIAPRPRLLVLGTPTDAGDRHPVREEVGVAREQVERPVEAVRAADPARLDRVTRRCR